MFISEIRGKNKNHNTQAAKFNLIEPIAIANWLY